MSTIYHGKKNNGIEVFLWHDKTSRCPYIVGYRLGNTGVCRENLAADNFKDAYAYYNELLA